jgi:hypothetical protein
VVQPALTNEALGNETRRYNSSIIHRGNAAEQRLKGNNPTGLPSGRLVNRTREFNIFSSTFLKTTGGKRDDETMAKKKRSRENFSFLQNNVPVSAQDVTDASYCGIKTSFFSCGATVHAP